MEKTVNLSITKGPIDDVVKLSTDPNILKLYANGFQCTFTLTDGVLVLKHNGAIIAMVTMSLAAIKTLHKNIEATVQGYEKQIGINIPTFEDLLPEQFKQQPNK